MKSIIILSILNFIIFRQSSIAQPSIIDIHSHISMLGAEVKIADRESSPKTITKIYSDAKFKKVGLIVIAYKNEKNTFKEKNDSLISFCSTDSRYFPICSVHPDYEEEAIEEVERLYGLGVRFIKLHSLSQDFDVASPNATKLISKIADMGMVILFDGWNPSDPSMLMKIVSVANRNPKGKFILAHMGGPNFNETILINIFKMYKWYANNIWVDFSGLSQLYANSPYADQIKWTIRKIGIDRVLFGSDYPFSTVEEAIESTISYNFEEDELNSIMFENSSNLLKSVGLK